MIKRHDNTSLIESIGFYGGLALIIMIFTFVGIGLIL